MIYNRKEAEKQGLAHLYDRFVSETRDGTPILFKDWLENFKRRLAEATLSEDTTDE